jgi:hypothetical protein
MSEKRLNDELAAIEAALCSLQPVPSNVQRDRLMFLAGRASADRLPLHGRPRLPAWLWPCATAASLLVAIALGVLWSTGGKPEIVERVVYVPAAGPSATSNHSASVRSSTAFADWQPAPWGRGKRADGLHQPKTAPNRRTPESSESRDRLHAAQSIT